MAAAVAGGAAGGAAAAPQVLPAGRGGTHREDCQEYRLPHRLED